MITGRGRFLIPGLIDGHVRLAMPPGLPYPAPPELAQQVAAYFTQLPRSYLYHGFTTLVDLNVVDREALAAFRQAPAHPELLLDADPLATAAAYDSIAVVIPRGRALERGSLSARWTSGSCPIRDVIRANRERAHSLEALHASAVLLCVPEPGADGLLIRWR